MKHVYSCAQGVVVLCLLQLLFIYPGNAQTLTARTNTYINDNCNGFYEYLPQGYNTGQQYPLLLTFHGLGEDGDGSPSQLSRLVNTGLPALLKSGTFPTSFTLNGNTFRFIIIAPQFKTNPAMTDVDAVYNYVVQHYPVNLNRVYVSGYSQGGGNTWEYTGTNSAWAAKVAAIVPIAGSVQLRNAWAQNIASTNLPVLATHNNGDPTIPSSWTVDNVNLINSSTPAPTPVAEDVIFNASGHDSWDYTYNPNQFSYNGLNMYQWMLQYQRSISSALPVTMGEYKAWRSDAGTVTISWTTLTELNNRSFTIERSSDGNAFSRLDTVAAFNQANGHSYTYSDHNPYKGTGFYRLLQTDIDGKTTYFSILKVAAAAGTQAGLRINPNPAGARINLELNHPETGDLLVMVSDMQGRTLRSWKFNKQNAVWQQSLDLGQLPAGNYTIQIRGTLIRETQQFVKL